MRIGTVGHVCGGGGFTERSSSQSSTKQTPRLDEAIVSSQYHLPLELKELIQRYPLFMVLLYRSSDSSLREYIRSNIYLMDSLSGTSCLIWLPEPVSSIGVDLKHRWVERIGSLPDWFEKTIDLGKCDFERISCDLAETFGVTPDKLPCFIVAEPHQFQCFCDQIDQQDDLHILFQDLIACAQLAKQYPVKKKTKAFRKEWNRRRRKTQKSIKLALDRTKEVLGVIKDIEKSILEILLPLAPVLESVISCFSIGKGKP